MGRGNGLSMFLTLIVWLATILFIPTALYAQASITGTVRIPPAACSRA